jgi:hypothetical protein
MSVVTDIGLNILFEAIQALFGCLVGFGIIKAVGGKEDLVRALNRESVLMIVLSTVFGLVLPMDIYAIAPVILASSVAGIRLSLVLPMLASNFMFNTLVPFTEVGFSWRTGWVRVVFAAAMGITAGILSSLLKVDGKILRPAPGNQDGRNSFASFFNQFMAKAGFFLIAGVILETIFKRYFFYGLVNLFDINGIATVVFGFIEGYNIASPVFILNMVMFNLVMNFKIFSGVIALFRWRGTAAFYAYFAAWVVLISIVNIFVA